MGNKDADARHLYSGGIPLQENSLQTMREPVSAHPIIHYCMESSATQTYKIRDQDMLQALFSCLLQLMPQLAPSLE